MKSPMGWTLFLLFCGLAAIVLLILVQGDQENHGPGGYIGDSAVWEYIERSASRAR